MASLNQEVLIIADAAGQPFNQPFKERVKALLITGYSKYAKQEATKYGIQDQYIASYKIDLEKVPLVGECTEPGPCKVLRSVNKIIKPINYRASEPFVAVTTENGVLVAIKTTRSASKHQKFAKFGHSTVMYEMRNDYLYVYGSLKLGRLMLDGIYDVFTFSEDCPGTSSCYQADYDIPLTGDYLMALRKEIFQELGIQFNMDREVPVTEEVQQSAPVKR